MPFERAKLLIPAGLKLIQPLAQGVDRVLADASEISWVLQIKSDAAIADGRFDHRILMTLGKLNYLKTITYEDHSHSIISWRFNSLADQESFGGHLYRSVRRYDKNLRLAAIDGEWRR